MNVRIGTRGSDLALWQAKFVGERLEVVGCEVDLVVLKTRGDRIDHVPLQTLEGKAFFTAEIETALLEERVDLAVHSHKDLPVVGPPGLRIVAIPERADPGERLVMAPHAHDPNAPFLPLGLGSTVGTSAPRRTEQLLALRPDLNIADLRGNVPTRVERLRGGRYDAIMVAAAGLDRLQLDTGGLVEVPLLMYRVVPAPGQGALAIQVRVGDERLAELVRTALHDETAAAAVRAERRLLVETGGGCNLPLGCSVVPRSGGWHARAFLGADHPTRGAPPRWAEALGADPDDAVSSVYRRLGRGNATRCGPMAGLRVAITGASSGGTRLGERLETLGASVLHEQVITFEALEGRTPREHLAALSRGDGLAVTSKEAARRLSGIEVPKGVVVAAVGPATEAELRRGGLEVDHVGEGGARELAETLPVEKGRRVLFPCAEDALADLEDGLRARGVLVERLPLYRTVARPAFEFAADLAFRIYMSPSAVTACSEVERALGDAAPARIAVGRTTTAALDEHGLASRVPRQGGAEAVVHLLARAEHTQEIRA